MNMRTSQWQTEALSKTFLEGVRGAIPGSSLQLSVIRKITQLWSPSPKAMLDLGCGDGVLGCYLLSLFPSAHCVFVDFSEPMLTAARKRLNADTNATVVNGDFSTPGWVDCTRGHGSFDIAISGFAIHHQPDNRKRALYAHSLAAENHPTV